MTTGNLLAPISASFHRHPRILPMMRLVLLVLVAICWAWAEWLLLMIAKPFWFVTASAFISGFALVAAAGVFMVDGRDPEAPENDPGQGD